MGGSVSPNSGPTYLVVGDAAGTVSPFNGDGIAYAYATGRIAAQVLHEALDANDATALQLYAKRLDDEFGQYFKVGRLFAAAIGHPTVMRELTRVSIRSRTLTNSMMRIMTNSLRPDETGAAELVYGAAAAHCPLSSKRLTEHSGYEMESSSAWGARRNACVAAVSGSDSQALTAAST